MSAMYACNGVEVFEAGTHRNRKYSVTDLDNMVTNFNRFSTGPTPLLIPPTVLGHEEDQKLLENSGLPAAGWVTKLWREGTKLKAKFSNIPAQIAKLINQQSYRKVSAEIYDEPPEGIPGKGMMLRRVALLGAEIPQVKTLADLPPAQLSRYHERATGIVRSQPAPLTFSEDRSMMPDFVAICGKLEAAGVKAEDALKLAQELSPMFSGEVAPEEPAPMADPAAPEAPVFDRAAAIAELVAKGMGQEEADALSDDELKAKLEEMKAAPVADMADPAPVAKPAVATAAAAPGPKSVTYKYTEADMAKVFKPLLAAAVAELRKEFSGIKSQTEQLATNTKRANIDAFCETMKREGRLLPANEAQVKSRLYRADAVQKFSEGKTELDLQMEEIKAGPVLTKFAALAGGPIPTEDPKEKVAKFYEERADQFKKAGVTKERFVKGFEGASQRGVTVEQYCR